MLVREIKPKVYSVGAIDWDRRLFDELIPLPDGTSYNAYLLNGTEKTALIDTVDPTKQDVLVHNLQGLAVEKIDYVISHHAEQDHSGAIPLILELFPGAKVVCSPKAKGLLQVLLHIDEKKFITVADGDVIALGDMSLQFIHTPWVHWPETMITYVRELQTLFTCDFFGSHLATSDLFATNQAEVYGAAKRYYAEIMMPFRKNIRKNLERVRGLEIETIAPSHGPIHSNPEFILSAYEDWVSDDVKNEVLVVYVSMHGSTEKMVTYLVDALINRNITVKPFNLSRTDIGELATALVDAATIVIASPTVLAGPHPLVVYASYLANALRPKAKFATVIASYGWGTKIVDQIAAMLGNLKVELLDPVVIKGMPKKTDLKLLDTLADQILAKHKEIGII